MIINLPLRSFSFDRSNQPTKVSVSHTTFFERLIVSNSRYANMYTVDMSMSRCKIRKNTYKYTGSASRAFISYIWYGLAGRSRLKDNRKFEGSFAWTKKRVLNKIKETILYHNE